MFSELGDVWAGQGAHRVECSCQPMEWYHHSAEPRGFLCRRRPSHTGMCCLCVIYSHSYHLTIWHVFLMIKCLPPLLPFFCSHYWILSAAAWLRHLGLVRTLAGAQALPQLRAPSQSSPVYFPSRHIISFSAMLLLGGISLVFAWNMTYFFSKF